MNTFSPDRFFIPVAMPVLAALTLATSSLQAGTWTHSKWTGDGDLPKVAPDSATHAVAFGIETDPAPPPPFEITKRISGENWSVWTYPEHAAAVEVTRRPEQILDSVKVKDSGAVLLKGRIIPKGKNQGLSIELTGLEPGKKYNLAMFGLAILGNNNIPGGQKIKVTASDAPDSPETLVPASGGGKYFVYEYTAPEDGTLKIDFENANTEQNTGVVRICAFYNYPAT